MSFGKSKDFRSVSKLLKLVKRCINYQELCFTLVQLKTLNLPDIGLSTRFISEHFQINSFHPLANKELVYFNSPKRASLVVTKQEKDALFEGRSLY